LLVEQDEIETEVFEIYITKIIEFAKTSYTLNWCSIGAVHSNAAQMGNTGIIILTD
jgi:hypothetical protein